MAPNQSDLDTQFRRLESLLPRRWAAIVRWLRQPGSAWVRRPAALLLIAGGFLWFLPVLGLWMLPLGLALIAQDLPFLQKPMARGLAWGLDKWERRRR